MLARSPINTEHFMYANQQGPFIGVTLAPTAVLLGMVLSACVSTPFAPATVVPTLHPLPYSAQVQVVEISAYPVQRGATLTTEPRTQNFAEQISSLPPLSEEHWKKTILDYVAIRQTFRRINTTERSDLTLALRVFFYVDPAVEDDFQYTYIAKAHANVIDPQTGRVVTHYTGFGKRFSPTSRASMEDDLTMLNPSLHSALLDQSLYSALNDLFDKIESDTQLASL
jgi:hypothetical protein